MAKLTLDDVNSAIKEHLRTSRLVISVVSRNGEDLKRQLAAEDASPMTYNSPKPAAITEEDKTVEKWPLHLRAADITVKPVGEVFQ